MGDTYWMKDELRGEWGKAIEDSMQIFRQSKKSARNKRSFDINFHIKNFISQKAQYPPDETGSQYLDPFWRHNIIDLNNNLIKIEALISLN
jgi:hypothetical protein